MCREGPFRNITLRIVFIKTPMTGCQYQMLVSEWITASIRYLFVMVQVWVNGCGVCNVCEKTKNIYIYVNEEIRLCKGSNFSKSSLAY